MDKLWCWFTENESGEVVLLRVFGSSPVVSVPEAIAGKMVVAIGDYCFAEKNKYLEEKEKIHIVELSEGNLLSFHAFEQARQRALFFELAGNQVTKVILPEGVNKLGSLSFYNCRKLSEISFGGPILEVGSDVFMNCHSLCRFVFSQAPEQGYGLKQLLAQRVQELEVFWKKGEELQAAAFFPEYSESYEVIGPAHIFELNISGEGFRARQCFDQGHFSFAQYDAVFGPACRAEEERVLCRMALDRLAYPYELSASFEQEYLDYLQFHPGGFCSLLIRQKDTMLLEQFIQRNYVSAALLDELLTLALQEKWTEAIRLLLDWKSRAGGKDEYAFEDF